MRTRITLAIALSLTFWTATRIHGQITSNPIPGRIEKRGLAVEIRDVVRLPDTRGIRPADQDVSPAWASVSYVRELPDGRRFANDSRGFLYLIDQNNRPQLYAGFVFHSQFVINDRVGQKLPRPDLLRFNCGRACSSFAEAIAQREKGEAPSEVIEPQKRPMSTAR